MSGACCTLPPVQAEYTPKGTYTEVSGLKSYVVGPEDSDKVIVFVYDVFGFSPQIIQGADLLASQGFRVVMPDFLVGKYVDAAMFSGSEEDNKRKTEYFSQFPGAFPTQSKPIADALAAVKTATAKVGAIGFCWGWKAIVLSEAVGKFDAIASAHPSFIAPEDANAISTPLALLPSKDEDKTACEAVRDAVEKKLPGQVVYKRYEQAVHGWAAARGDLKGGQATDDFADAYQTLSAFFKKYL
ncbi:hypothetical protein Q5752_005689 [Cryptotrichosporon argae]